MTLSHPDRPADPSRFRQYLRNGLVMACLAGLTLPAAAKLSRLPSLGGGDILERQAQQSAGLNYLRALNQQGFTLQDPAVTYYLEQSLLPLLPAYDLPVAHDDLTVFGIRNPSFNAFALPGGLIGVHQGLLARLETTDELQAILAHELSHLALDHHSRLAESRQQSTALIIASFLLAPFAFQASPNATMGMLYGAQGLAIQQQLSFSRDMEEEADRIALEALRSGRIPLRGLVGAYETMAEEQRRQSGQAGSSYPGTHPDVRNRLADLRNRIDTASASDSNAREYHPLPLCWIRIDLGLAPGAVSSNEDCRRYSINPEENPVERYQKLLGRYPGNPYVLYRAANVAAASPENDTLPLALLDGAALTPDSWLAALAVLKVLPAGDAQARTWLATLAGGAPENDVESWSTLARHYDALNARARALRAQAQVSWISGSLEVALRQVELAIALTDRPAEAAAWRRIQTRWERLTEH